MLSRDAIWYGRRDTARSDMAANDHASAMTLWHVCLRTRRVKCGVARAGLAGARAVHIGLSRGKKKRNHENIALEACFSESRASRIERGRKITHLISSKTSLVPLQSGIQRKTHRRAVRSHQSAAREESGKSSNKAWHAAPARINQRATPAWHRASRDKRRMQAHRSAQASTTHARHAACRLARTGDIARAGHAREGGIAWRRTIINLLHRAMLRLRASLHPRI